MKLILTFTFTVFVVFSRAQTTDEAQSEFARGNFNRAAKQLQDIVIKDNRNAQAWAMLARTYVQLGRDVTDTLALAPETLSNEPYLQVAKGILSLSHKDKAVANSYFEKAISETKGKDVPLLLMVADSHIESPHGDYDYAISVLQKAIKRAKKNAAPYTSLGQAYLKLHNGTEAYRSLTEALNKDYTEARAYYALGKLFLTQKNTELYTEYFQKAIAADPGFTPALYELYQHFLYRDPATAKLYFLRYRANADYSVQQDYSYTDLLYLTKNYDSAILHAKRLIDQIGEKIQPRIYKLISYSLQEKADTASAIKYMTAYFEKEVDSNLVIKDYETMGLLYRSSGGEIDSAAYYFEKALALAKDEVIKLKYYQTLATLAKTQEDNAKEAYWRRQIYTTDAGASNVALFNWGLSAYKAQNYLEADSVFGLYASKYADQGHGYYWRARSNAAMDSAIEKGLAVSYYQQLIEVVKSDTLSEQDKKWMKEAYGYLGTYEANTEKDYPEAITYFEELLNLDPANDKVVQSIEILQKSLAAESTTTEAK